MEPNEFLTDAGQCHECGAPHKQLRPGIIPDTPNPTYRTCEHGALPRLTLTPEPKDA